MNHALKLAGSLALASLLATAALAPRDARAGVNVDVHVGLPVAPPLVVVQPGVQVVEDWHEEVYFVNGWYWVRRDGGWYRARHPRAAFAYCAPRHVPVKLVRIPPGQYVRYRKHEEKAERKAWKEHQKAEKHARKHHDKHGGHDDHGHDDHGHGKHGRDHHRH